MFSVNITKIYTCFITGSLRTHIKGVHRQIRPHKCPECNLSHTTLSGLKVHMRCVYFLIIDNFIGMYRTGQTINQSINQSFNRSIDQSINQSINQLINQSTIDQSINLLN